MKIKPFPNEQQEKDICNIILAGGKISTNVTKYLKENNLCIIKRDRSYSVSILIKRLIDKYHLNENIHINKYDNIKSLTQNEFDVIVGGLLGDSWLGIPKNGKHPCGSFTHKLEHTEYVYYKYQYLKRLCSIPRVHNKYDKRTNRKYQQSFCKICATSALDNIYKSFYINGVKIVPEELINKLSPLGLAIWFMDDGSSDLNGYKFSVDCFIEEDIIKLVNMLKTNFNIDCTYNINQNRVIHVKLNSTKKFKSLVEPYICDCMKYKLKIYKSINGILTKVDI